MNRSTAGGRRYSQEYQRETGRTVVTAESGRSVCAEYVEWLEEKLSQSQRRELILQSARGR